MASQPAPAFAYVLFGLCLVGCIAQPTQESRDTEAANASGNGTMEGASSADAEGNVVIAQPPGCGTQTVTTLPRELYVERVSTAVPLTASPADSPLAKVLYPEAVCGRDVGSSFVVPESGRQLYEVGSDGRVIAVCTLTETPGTRAAVCLPFEEWRFVIDDGCLELRQGSGGDMGNFDIADILDSVVQNPLCEPGEIPLSRRGLLGPVEDGEPYICIRFEVEHHCTDCGTRDGEWFETTELRFSATARGSLDGVSAEEYARLCNSPESTVNIRSGDRVTITRSYTVTYRASPSPHELGYIVNGSSEFEWPVNP